MTTLESTKYRLITAILGDSDEDRVFKIERMYKQRPCELL